MPYLQLPLLTVPVRHGISGPPSKASFHPILQGKELSFRVRDPFFVLQ